MKSERFDERAPSKDAFPRIEFRFSNTIFGPWKELQGGVANARGAVTRLHGGQETGRVWTAMMSP